MKFFKVFAETDIIEMENNFNDIGLALEAFNKVIDDPDVTHAYIMNNVTGELLATYDTYYFFGSIKAIRWVNLDLVD